MARVTGEAKTECYAIRECSRCGAGGSARVVEVARNME